MAITEQEGGAEKRLIGVVVPVGALRGTESAGVGEFPDLVEFAELCRRMGVGLIQLLPVNDTGYFSAPYFALSAFALHPIYLRLGDLPELRSSSRDILQQIKLLGQIGAGEARFPFEPILRVKMALLREIYSTHSKEIAKRAEPGGSLGIWIEENPWIKEYAVYRRFKGGNEEKSWQEWTSNRRISKAEIEALWNNPEPRWEHLFWAWVQEALDSQFRKAAEAVAKLGILLEGDLPILINEDSCDVWAHPEYFHLELSAGAPPDMYSPEGQNWGFPLHNWEAQAKDDYAWWRQRLRVAEKYYRAYRIDHVLGFFRIWASPRADQSSALGRFVPYIPVDTADLRGLGFDESRTRWVSRPHIPTAEVWDALRKNWGGNFAETDIAVEAERALSAALDRIGDEDLWLFKDTIAGEKDIIALGLHPAAQDYLLQAWHNRMFLEYEKGHFFPTWYYRYSRAYASLTEDERNRLEELLEKRRVDSEAIWEKQGKGLLSILAESSSMLPCAEDLGAVPDCVPRVLATLKILGLRVVRWNRDWEKEGEPYVPFEDYPELSVCTPAVHDSSTLREWWEREADQGAFCGFTGVPSLPKIYNPGAAKIILQKTASAASRFRVFQIQDLLHLSPRWYAEDPASERVNVPGTVNEFNWTYRLPASMAEIGKDEDLIQAVTELGKIGPAKKKKGSKK
jgi:4-alpha-glucanotransferase